MRQIIAALVPFIVILSLGLTCMYLALRVGHLITGQKALLLIIDDQELELEMRRKLCDANY